MQVPRQSSANKMAAAVGGRFLTSIFMPTRLNTGCSILPVNVAQVRNYAARKGTREKARKAKVKRVIAKLGFIPHKDRKKKVTGPRNPRFKDSARNVSPDNVWVMKYYQWKVYPFAEAVQCHKEIHHPTMTNTPNAFLKALIELNMTDTKPTKFLDSFSRMVYIPHKFDQGENRTCLAICNTPELQEQAREAGATLVGAEDVIKGIKSGDIVLSEYDAVVAHPNILPELVPLRAIMKRKFPNPKAGTFGPDIAALVHKFINGIRYRANAHETQKDYGLIDVAFGTLNMDAKLLEENFSALVNNVQENKPKREGVFITSVRLVSPPLKEMLKVDHKLYLPAEETVAKQEEEETEALEEEEQKTANVVL